MDALNWLPPAMLTWLPSLGSMLIGVLVASLAFRIGERIVRRATLEARGDVPAQPAEHEIGSEVRPGPASLFR